MFCFVKVINILQAYGNALLIKEDCRTAQGIIKFIILIERDGLGIIDLSFNDYLLWAMKQLLACRTRGNSRFRNPLKDF